MVTCWLCPRLLLSPARSRISSDGSSGRRRFESGRRPRPEQLEETNLGEDAALEFGQVDALVGAVDAGMPDVLGAPEDELRLGHGQLQGVEQRDRGTGTDQLRRAAERFGQR